MKRGYGTLVALLAILVSGKVCAQPSAAVEPRDPRVPAIEWVTRMVRDPTTQPYPDVGMTDGVPNEYPRTPSAWQSREKAYYEELLSKGFFEVLVVPFQVQLYALDRPTRSLMTAELSLAIAAQKSSLPESNRSRIPDPYLVARALGDGDRRFNPGDVYRLANKLHVRRIVWSYVGHDRKNEMRMTIQHQDRGARSEIDSSTPVVTHQFEKIVFSDEKPPLEVYLAMLPGVLKSIGLEPPDSALTKQDGSAGNVVLPPTLLGVISEQAEPRRDAHYLQLLAALAPAFADRVRERLVEKSLLTILRMRPDSSDYRLLKARALAQLGLRPAAMIALGTPVSIEEKCLRAVLDGNLREAEKLAAQIKPGLKMLIARLEVNAMAVAFGVREQKRSVEEANALKPSGKTWPLLLTRAMTDLDAWSQYENMQLKDLLDRELPIPGFTAEGIIRGAVALGDLKKAQALADLSVHDHIKKLRLADQAKWCCLALTARPAMIDYLDFIESVGDDNLMRRARFFTRVQGAPDTAMEFLSRIESVYKDHPQFALARADAEALLAKRADGAAKEGLLKSAYLNASNSRFWEQGQTHAAAYASHLLAYEIPPHFQYGNPDNYYAGDYPFKSYFPTFEQSGLVVENAQAALKNSMFDFSPALALADRYALEKRWDGVEEFIKSIEKRFVGHPSKSIILAKVSEKKGDVEAAERYFRTSIAEQPGYWDSYMDLGRLLIETGQLGTAAKIFAGYPGFKRGSGENPVAQANYLFDAGSLLYWTGNFALATPLYRMAAELRTGAEASIETDNRIRLMKGDYAGAAAGALARAKRYNSIYGYRDYLGLLHAMGQSKEAWDAFNLLARQFDAPQVWETALVGHRLAGTTEAQLGAWVGQDWVKNAGRFGYAAMYLVRSGLTDRMPTNDLPRLVAAVDRPVYKNRESGQIARPALGKPEDQQILGPKSSAESNLVWASPDLLRGERVKSDLVSFAEAYRALRAGDFRSAHAELKQSSTLLDMTQPALSYLLPYYAFAAAKSGDVSVVVAVLDRMPAERRRFDYYLARAAIAGIAGNAVEASRQLDAGLRRRPFTENRPLFTEYQFADICEMLYVATRDTKYRDKGLDWARKVQIFSPWDAWAYAFEAKYSRNAEQRRRAIAFAHYLDRNSERLAAVPKGELDAAVKTYGQKNPFLRKEAAPKEKSAGLVKRALMSARAP